MSQNKWQTGRKRRNDNYVQICNRAAGKPGAIRSNSHEQCLICCMLARTYGAPSIVTKVTTQWGPNLLQINETAG
jgi:hypothetical protein